MNYLKNNNIIFIIILFVFYSCNKDIENVILEGYVYADKKPLENVVIEIENAIYEGGDFDGYSKYQQFIIKTDKNGYYKIYFKKSAYIQVNVIKKGYTKRFEDFEVFSKKINKNFTLDKIP